MREEHFFIPLGLIPYGTRGSSLALPFNLVHYPFTGPYRWLGLVGDATIKPVPGIFITALAWHASTPKCGCSISCPMLSYCYLMAVSIISGKKPIYPSI